MVVNLLLRVLSTILVLLGASECANVDIHRTGSKWEGQNQLLVAQQVTNLRQLEAMNWLEGSLQETMVSTPKTMGFL